MRLEGIPIDVNETFLVIGEVLSVYLEQDIIEKDGFLRLDEAGTLCSNGLDAYYSVVEEGRFSYAKPDTPLHRIN